MNYLKNINKFEVLAELNELPDKTYRLWYVLMSINNACGWIHWFKVPLKVLRSRLGTENKTTIYNARNQLVQLGLLKVAPGKSGSAAKYHLIPLVQDDGTNQYQDVVPSSVPSDVPDSVPSGGPLNKQDKNRKDKTNTPKAPRGKKTKPDKPKLDPVVEKQVDQIIDHLNERLGNKNGEGFRKSTGSTRKAIRARIKQSSYLACIAVIDVKANEWLGGDYEKYLRPSTLFRPSNFEEYLTQARQEYRRKHNHKMTDRERDQKELEHLAGQYSF